MKKESDKAILDESRYLLAIALVQVGQRDEARALFTEIVQKGGRYVGNAREQLANLEAPSSPPPRASLGRRTEYRAAGLAPGPYRLHRSGHGE